MFWIGQIKQIWVLKITGEGHGTWEVYQDTFVDGEPENDPSLVPPDGRYQPQRGFGKLWRESPGLRENLGWGVTPEFGYVSHYEYHAGGTIDANGKYVPGPGYPYSVQPRRREVPLQRSRWHLDARWRLKVDDAAGSLPRTARSPSACRRCAPEPDGLF